MTKIKAKTKVNKSTSSTQPDPLFAQDLQVAIRVSVLLIVASVILSSFGVNSWLTGGLFWLAAITGVGVAIVSMVRVVSDVKSKRPVSFERWCVSIVGFSVCTVILLVSVQALLAA